jgi:hypothetical protein
MLLDPRFDQLQRYEIVNCGDERRIKCLKCGKKSWHKRNHTRGDKALGEITKEYKLIAT